MTVALMLWALAAGIFLGWMVHEVMSQPKEREQRIYQDGYRDGYDARYDDERVDSGQTHETSGNPNDPPF